MQYAPLVTVRHRLNLGGAVPFNIRNLDHTLLLARGQLLRDEAQLSALLSRDAVVDAEELKGPRAEVYEALPEALPALWSRYMARVGRTLRQPDPHAFAQALDAAALPVLALVERDPDLAIFQLLRPDPAADTAYGVMHSVHSAIAANLVAQRLGWDAANVELVFKAALTMNMAMLELQARLASQVTRSARRAGSALKMSTRYQGGLGLKLVRRWSRQQTRTSGMAYLRAAHGNGNSCSSNWEPAEPAVSR